MVDPNILCQNLHQVKELLTPYHGATKLQNIPELTSSRLYADLIQEIPLDLSLTVRAVVQRINDILSAESVVLQFERFQDQKHNMTILPSQKLPENQRLDFYASRNTHEWLEMIFSPEQYYFTLSPKSFRKGDKKYNRGVFHHAIDTVVIDPEKVGDSSLEALGITLDPDCQNLKDIFKAMYPLYYQDIDETKHTIRIHEYQGKYIVFVAHKIVYAASPKPTKAEKKKQDVQGHMSVYSDIFSMIRREEHIIDTNKDKQGEYQEIKKDIIRSIKEIDRNKKEYGPRVKGNIQEIIAQIDAATSATIVATKLYHLYNNILGKHSSNDKKLLEASMKNFTQRIAQLIGISSHTQLHLLTLTDTLEDQNITLEFFYTQIRMFLADPTITYPKFLIAFENYYNAQKGPLKEPFRTFDRQIKSSFGTMDDLKTKKPDTIMLKADIITTLQRKYRETYTWEHAYKRGELSMTELQQKFLDTSADVSLKQHAPGVYDLICASINQKRAKFSPDFSPGELDRFFDGLNDLDVLQSVIDSVNTLLV